MNYIPHDYQTQATNFILEHEKSAVFLDMGLGKSVITLTAIKKLCVDRKEVKKVLVIAPFRVAQYTWPEELKKWDHLKSLTFSVVMGTAEKRKKALDKPADIHIINTENVAWLINDSGHSFDFDMLVVDELSSFKNHKSKRFRALAKVCHLVKRVIGLTGTPASNSFLDLWSEFYILDQGERLERKFYRFLDKYFQPCDRFGYKYKPRLGSEQKIQDNISDITISMKAIDLLKLPECFYHDIYVTLSDKEYKAYNSIKNDLFLRLGGEEIDVKNAAALCTKLLQIANGMVYLDGQDGEKSTAEIHTRKLEALESLLESANGKNVLIACWYKHDQARIKAKFGARSIDTEQDIRAWNEGKIPIGIIHPFSAGRGLNLQQGGSILIWYGLAWSLEGYLQTNARIYRQGQSNTVMIYHILAANTIDSEVLKRLQRKDTSQKALLEAVRAEMEA